jgi:hypothetical protein
MSGDEEEIIDERAGGLRVAIAYSFYGCLNRF